MNTTTFKKRINRAYTKAGKIGTYYDMAVSYLTRLQKGEKVHPYAWTRSKGHYGLIDRAARLLELLDWAKIDYERGNDAPRGGKEGDYIVLSASGRRALSGVDLTAI